MKSYTIIFPNDSEETANEKIAIVKRLAGETNVSYMNDIAEFETPQITIRCKNKIWKEIKFQIDLQEVYW